MNNQNNSFSDDELRGMITGNNPVSNAYRELLACREAQGKAVAIVDIQSDRPDENKFAFVFTSAMKKLHDDVYHLFTAPQLPVVPDVLPCPVKLEPGLTLGKGVKTQTLLDALIRREKYYAELEAMTPEQRAEMDKIMEDARKVFGHSCAADINDNTTQQFESLRRGESD